LLRRQGDHSLNVVCSRVAFVTAVLRSGTRPQWLFRPVPGALCAVATKLVATKLVATKLVIAILTGALCAVATKLVIAILTGADLM
jgi:hypothetical protein